MSKNHNPNPNAHIEALLRDLKDTLTGMEKRLTALLSNPPIHFEYSIEVSYKKRTHNMPLKIKISDEQQVNVKLNPVTPKGKPVKVDGIPVWAIADPPGDTVSTLVPAADGLSCLLVSSVLPGVTNITVSADADLGEGVNTISDTIELTVTDPQATSLGLVADPATDKP